MNCLCYHSGPNSTLKIICCRVVVVPVAAQVQIFCFREITKVTSFSQDKTDSGKSHFTLAEGIHNRVCCGIVTGEQNSSRSTSHKDFFLIILVSLGFLFKFL